MNTPKYLIIHHTGGTDANPKADSSNFTFEQCDELHKRLFNFKSSLGKYCGYHYYINKQGVVTQARAHTDTGAHTIGQNNSSIGICLAGNFDATDPTPAQIDALRPLLIQLMGQFKIPAANIVPHRTFAKKTCYGDRLSENWARSLVSFDPSVEKEKMLWKEILRLTQKLEELRAEYKRRYGKDPQ